MLEARQLLTGGPEDLGPGAATYLANFATQKLEEKLESMFSAAGNSWTSELNAGFSQSVIRALQVPGNADFDDTVEEDISNAGGTIQAQVASVQTTISTANLDLVFGGAFGYGNNVTTVTDGFGGSTGGTGGSSEYTDYGGFWYTGQINYVNPAPAAGVSLDKIIADVSVGGMAPTFQGDITINRKLEMVNGDKKNFAITFHYFGDDVWLYSGSATRKIGGLMLEVHANGNQTAVEEFGIAANYVSGPLTFDAEYQNDYGFDTFAAGLRSRVSVCSWMCCN